MDGTAEIQPDPTQDSLTGWFKQFAVKIKLVNNKPKLFE